VREGQLKVHVFPKLSGHVLHSRTWYVQLCFTCVSEGRSHHPDALADLSRLSVRAGKASQEESAGREALPGEWESLCDDVRRVIVGKLPLPDIAFAGSTCQEFQSAFQAKLTQEAADLISIGEQTFWEGPLPHPGDGPPTPHVGFVFSPRWRPRW
jgi:hypothetical protein